MCVRCWATDPGGPKKKGRKEQAKSTGPLVRPLFVRLSFAARSMSSPVTAAFDLFVVLLIGGPPLFYWRRLESGWVRVWLRDPPGGAWWPGSGAAHAH